MGDNDSHEQEQKVHPKPSWRVCKLPPGAAFILTVSILLCALTILKTDGDIPAPANKSPVIPVHGSNCPYPLINSTKCAPALFIGGAMKCGTNEAMHLLTLHPRACFNTCNPRDNSTPCSRDTHQGAFHPHNGETRIWESAHLPQPDHLEAIAARLPNTDGVNTVNFDKAPRYIETNLEPRLPVNMKMFMPGTKMVFSVCDPAERMVSEFHHLQKIKVEWIFPGIHMPATFEEFVKTVTGKADICRVQDCRDNYLNKGWFAKHIQKWLEVYDPSEIVVIDMNEPAESQARKLLEFAGLPLGEYPWEKLNSTKKAYKNNAYAGRQSAWEEHRDPLCALSKYYAHSNKDLSKLLNQHYPLEWKSTTAVGTLCK